MNNILFIYDLRSRKIFRNFNYNFVKFTLVIRFIYNVINCYFSYPLFIKINPNKFPPISKPLNYLI